MRNRRETYAAVVTIARQRGTRGASPEAGQAAVETAIMLPLWIFTLLGILQLSLMHQARILTEYAAFQAARAGIVWNGDPEKMQDAAIFVLAPTACPSRAPGVSALCNFTDPDDRWSRQAVGVGAMQLLSASEALTFPGVHVHILNPYWPTHAGLFKTGERTELDFDNLREPLPRIAQSPAEPDPATRASREANVLTIRVQYWYELKIPFADWVIWYSYLASAAGLSITGSIENPTLQVSGADGASIVEHGDADVVITAAAARLASSPIRGNELNRGTNYELVRLSALAAMFAAGRGAKAYFVPITAHHSMRMQSNFYRKYIDGSGDSRAW